VAYAAGLTRSPAIVVTGSHIPFDRNGLKFYLPSGELLKEHETQMQEALVEGVPPCKATSMLPAPDPDAQDAYRQRYLNYFGAQSLSGLSVGVYQHSSVARDVLCELLTALGARVTVLGRTDDFVPIDTEAVRVEDVLQGRDWAAQHSFDAIVSTDGDGDRPLIADRHGNWLRGDIVGLLCAQHLNADVVVTPVSSNSAVEKLGSFAEIVRTKIGSPFVIEAMNQFLTRGDSTSDAVVGYEANGGVLWGGSAKLPALVTRDAVLPILSLLDRVVKSKKPLDVLVNELPSRFTHSDRLQNIPAELSQALLSRVTAQPEIVTKWLAVGDHVGVAQVNRVDGIRVILTNDDVVHIRPSGNAPELRVYCESQSAAIAQANVGKAMNAVALEVVNIEKTMKI
jgi:phosphomannomutase